LAILAAIVLTGLGDPSKLESMKVRLKPETESRLNELAAKTGRTPEDLVEDAMAGYLAEVSEVRQMLDRRYDDIKSGRVTPVDGDNGS
jgi:predicted transcriptional regulator